MTGQQVRRAFRVTGRVQGVGFRWFTRDTAHRLGLAGWVANDPDGAVSGEVCGDASRVAAFVRALRDGPPGARISDLQVDEVPDGPEDSTFEIRR
ncbi:MAG: acylphosphatase [Gemmatimonadota bacterium]|nr:acylphosphatase [Gemmatimonadota bacterium]